MWQRICFNVAFSFFGCAGFHIGMNAGGVEHIMSDLRRVPFLASTLLCVVMNQAGLFQPQPHKEEPR